MAVNTSASFRGLSVVSDRGLVAETVVPNEVRVWDLATRELLYSALFDVPGVAFRSVGAINDAGQLIGYVFDNSRAIIHATGSYLYEPRTGTWTELLLNP